jgi:hypothetical protein
VRTADSRWLGGGVLLARYDQSASAEHTGYPWCVPWNATPVDLVLELACGCTTASPDPFRNASPEPPISL